MATWGASDHRMVRIGLAGHLRQQVSLWRVFAWGLTLVGAIGAATVFIAVRSQVPGDALGVLLADPAHPYAGAHLGGEAAYLYAPVVVQVLEPLRTLPGFIDAWRIAEAAALIVLAGPFSLLFLVASPTVLELRLANINLLLGLAIAASFRRPWLWAFVLLTKVTPGVGLLWFAVRREWRSLAIAIGTTAAVVLASALFIPGAWIDWIDLLVREGSSGLGPGWALVVPLPLAVRIVLAAALVSWGAWTDRRWTVVVAAFVALPATWPTALTMLAAVIPLLALDIRVPQVTSRLGWAPR